MFDVITEAAINFSEVLIYVLCVNSIYHSEEKKKRTAFGIVTTIVYMVIIQLLNMYNQPVHYFNTYMSVAILAVMSWLFFRKNIKTDISIAVSYTAFTGIVEIIALCGVSVVFNDVDYVLKIISIGTFERILLAICLKAFLFVIYIIFVRGKDSEYFDFLNSNMYLLAVVIGFAADIKMQGIIQSNSMQGLKVGIAFMFIVFVFMVVFIIYVSNRLFADKAMVEKQKNIAVQNKILEESLKNTNMLYAENSKGFHEFRHHLDMLDGMAKNKQYDKIESYISSINVERTYVNKFSTGNEVLDMVLNVNYSEAKKRDITFTYDIQPVRELDVDDADLCSLVANLFENAVEAAEKTEDGYISFGLKSKGNIVTIILSNTAENNPVPNNMKSKKKGNHGWGMKIIGDIVKKYDGYYTTDYKDGVFTIKIIMFGKTEVTKADILK